MQQSIALEILKSGKNVFMTGSAGTGKTYVLNQYIRYLKERRVSPSILAPTGIAASHLGGVTIHSFFSLGIRDSVDEEFLSSLLEKKALQTRFSKLKVLIIDEVSMISPAIFTAMDIILKGFKRTDLPFGGIQVILSGDFFQLPPVSRNNPAKRFAWQAPAWRELELRTCYMEKKFRQEDDAIIHILDDIRSGNISQKTHELLESRFRQELSMEFRPTKLYTHNIDVDRINQDELNALASTPQHFKSENTGSKANIEKIFKTSLVLEEITLKQNAIVIFIKNNQELGYVNGTTGVITGFDKESKVPIVKLSDNRVLKVERENWMVENAKGETSAKVSQLPLRLAWAITIHKSQGMTLDSAEIDLSKTFESGQGYVALSRIKSLQGLRLMGINDMALQVDPLILSIDDRIKGASQKASTEIEALSLEEKERRANEFISSIGGTINTSEIESERVKLSKVKEVRVKSKVPNHLQTLELIKDASSLSELAQMRGFTVGTIINHIAKIKEEKKDLDIEKFRPDKELFNKVNVVVEELVVQNREENFTESKVLKMKPIFEA
ncbi:MAG: AAA family ATPase, partial [Campylobacterota bacterium]|nr:AAA family ATPase [Campylobacterota bacterium]